MEVNTKHNVGEKLFLIDNNEIISLPVKHISVEIGQCALIKYSFVVREGVSFSLDNDQIIYRMEHECFKSIDELAESFKK